MTFDVHEGEVVTLLGRNGAGKTTTLKSIMGIVGQRTGSVRFDGDELIARTSESDRRAGVAFCPEERGVFASLSVEENLLLPPVVKPGGLTIDRSSVCFPISRSGWDEPGNQTLRRRAANAGNRPILRTGARSCCSTSRPKAWRRDHPADRPHHPEVKDHGFTILLVEQNFRFASTVADRYYVMEHGRIIDQFANAELDANVEKLHDYLGVLKADLKNSGQKEERQATERTSLKLRYCAGARAWLAPSRST